MKQKFDKYWKGLEQTNNLLILAVVLDPRYKLGYVKFRFDSIYGVEESQSMIFKLKGVLLDLYDSYNRFYGILGGGVKETDDVFSLGVGSGPSDDIEFGRLKATDKEDSLWGMKQQEEDVNKGKNEVDLYLLERPEKLNERFDVLAWWKNSLMKFPILSIIARDVFAIPVSTVASESAFSTGGHILDSFRSSLTPKIVEGLISTGNWLQPTCPIAEPRVVQEHAQNENESVHLLEHYINIETEYENGVANVSMEHKN
ncbi:hypothetical protein Ddye_002079 [Dipteronia dyeriana]|uniref:HAT C-terminal dimerisation domain-containing protein n=1 Tax=Dipteronia dyeriana TaxID=168575 RepID=A0AAE0CU05_9ROSI|nr:hypothetical protein Ddye_002079 [Dipteronia dyeriana]